MECTECKYRKQIALKRCKHFELGGDKKRKVRTICYDIFKIKLILNFLVSRVCVSYVQYLSKVKDSNPCDTR